MPDLDDLFEDIADGLKKRLRKQKKRYKKSKEKPPKSSSSYSLMGWLGGWFGERAAHESAQRAPSPSVGGPPSVATPGRGATTVRCATLRRYLEQARAYEVGILELTHSASGEFNRTRIAELNRHIDHWQKSLAALVQRVDDFQQNELLQHDLQAIPRAVVRLESQLAEASSERIRHELARTLTNRQQQLTSLQNLRDLMQWAEIKIENTVSMLGAIYSQALMSQSKGQVANYQRLLADVEEEARSLDDYVAAVTEIKLGSAAVGPFPRETLPSWNSSG
ncbi:MAG: hypothetical protein R3A44_21735 [Caldilineaceae bacterium]